MKRDYLEYLHKNREFTKILDYWNSGDFSRAEQEWKRLIPDDGAPAISKLNIWLAFYRLFYIVEQSVHDCSKYTDFSRAIHQCEKSYVEAHNFIAPSLVKAINQSGGYAGVKAALPKYVELIKSFPGVLEKTKPRSRDDTDVFIWRALELLDILRSFISLLSGKTTDSGVLDLCGLRTFHEHYGLQGRLSFDDSFLPLLDKLRKKYIDSGWMDNIPDYDQENWLRLLGETGVGPKEMPPVGKRTFAEKPSDITKHGIVSVVRSEARLVKVWTYNLRARRISHKKVLAIRAAARLVAEKRGDSVQFYFAGKLQASPRSEQVVRVIEHTLKNRGTAGDIHALLKIISEDALVQKDLAQLRDCKAALSIERDCEKYNKLHVIIDDLDDKLEKREGAVRSFMSKKVNRYLGPLKISISAPLKTSRRFHGRPKYRLTPMIEYCFIEY